MNENQIQNLIQGEREKRRSILFLSVNLFQRKDWSIYKINSSEKNNINQKEWPIHNIQKSDVGEQNSD